MYFHTDKLRDLMWLRDVLTEAVRAERSVRLDVDSEGNLKVKVGEGMWTAPIAGTPDPYRDPPKSDPLVEAATEGMALNEPIETVCGECRGRDGSHFLDCSFWPWGGSKN